MGSGIAPELIDRPQHPADCGTADPVRRAFIRNGESPSSGARTFSLRIAAVGNRTRPGNYNHSRSHAQSGLQRDLHIATTSTLQEITSATIPRTTPAISTRPVPA